jgi:hypothetical protein
VTVGSSCADTSVGEVVSSGFCASALMGVNTTATANIAISDKTNLFIIGHLLLNGSMFGLFEVGFSSE